MALLALGLNHATAPLDIREKVVFGDEIVSDALHDLRKHGGVDEAAILSTCNRTEIYCSHDLQDLNRLVDWLTGYHGFRRAELQPFLYSHPDASAVKHMLRVASGLDSMILGEPQVLGQLKNAYHQAVESGSIGQLLGRLFQHSFMVAKEIRSNTAIGKHPVSVAFAAIRLAQQIFGDLSERTALLIGAGETIALAARHLHEMKVDRMIIANRTLERSQRLAEGMNAFAITLQDIPIHLDKADIIFSATASPLPILGKGAIESAIKKRKHRPIFIVDMAVPRDIEPEAGELEDVYLYTVDDLREVIEENLRNRQEAAVQAEEIIDTHVLNFMEWLNSLDAVSTIRALRGQAVQIQTTVVEAALLKLKQGGDPEKVVLEAIRSLTNKIIHAPSAQLRNAEAANRQELLQAARKLFNLTENDFGSGKQE
ncbi:MAG: glutamyl-tRNA reductase [Gammaproteobacteria bacterium RIFCSPLOWO2_02_FULL_56_15]|nr:MAG: glutamyl-tRNA reductase [Gammaproteobacteria bacterium RIFCSPLOWO2_02_FULL_56_15]